VAYARSLATLDRLALGRTAWIIELAPAERADRGREAECIEVARKLWDSWEDDAFIVDKERGLVADPGKVASSIMRGRISPCAARSTSRGRRRDIRSW
jgi:hypothetical protein